MFIFARLLMSSLSKNIFKYIAIEFVNVSSSKRIMFFIFIFIYLFTTFTVHAPTIATWKHCIAGQLSCGQIIDREWKHCIALKLKSDLKHSHLNGIPKFKMSPFCSRCPTDTPFPDLQWHVQHIHLGQLYACTYLVCRLPPIKKMSPRRIGEDFWILAADTCVVTLKQKNSCTIFFPGSD